MSRKKATPSSTQNGNSNSGIIIVAIIGLLGTLATAVFGFLASVKPTEISIYATQTAEAKLTLAAQTIATPTPSSTITPSVIDIEDLQADLLAEDCINSKSWFSLDNEISKQGSNCLLLDNFGIFAKYNGLSISSTNSSEVRIRHGIFTPIENGTQIRFKLIISELYTPKNDDLANLSLGIISKSSFNLEDDTLLIYQRESPQKGYPILVKQEERGGIESYLSLNGGHREYAKHTTQEILLDVSKTNQLTIYIDGSPVIQVAVPFEDKVFWIGYRLSGNCLIEAEISELQIQKQ